MDTDMVWVTVMDPGFNLDLVMESVSVTALVSVTASVTTILDMEITLTAMDWDMDLMGLVLDPMGLGLDLMELGMDSDTTLYTAGTGSDTGILEPDSEVLIVTDSAAVLATGSILEIILGTAPDTLETVMAMGLAI